MKSFPAATMRALDRRTIDEYGIPGIVLMENAGTALTHEILRFVSGMRNPEFMILAGKGNNGGDALIAAGQLFSKQYPVTLFMAARPDELTGDAAEAFEELPQKLKEQIQFDFTADSIGENAVLVDGLLGTGIRGALREPFATWIRIINDSRNPVVSIDLPSGLNADDGSADCCVTADLTVKYVFSTLRNEDPVFVRTLTVSEKRKDGSPEAFAEAMSLAARRQIREIKQLIQQEIKPK